MASPRITIRRTLIAAILCLACVAGTRASAAAPEVVVSIKPLHSLVAGVMEGVAKPTLLVRGAASPHTYTLRPSDAQALAGADVVFWLGEALELFLARSLATLAEQARIVELGQTPGLLLLAPRAGRHWEPHADVPLSGDPDGDAREDEHEHGEGEAHGHEHAAYDSHLWLDPRNAVRLAARISTELGEADPANAQRYQQNAAALARRIEALDAELESMLAPARGVPFIVFHDAYQYFEARYGLAAAGAVTVSPEQPPGARRLQEIRDRIAAGQVRCVFREPNFDPALVDRLLEGTSARSGALDPEGAALDEGPALYFELMRAMAQSVRECLGGSS